MKQGMAEVTAASTDKLLVHAVPFTPPPFILGKEGTEKLIAPDDIYQNKGRGGREKYCAHISKTKIAPCAT